MDITRSIREAIPDVHREGWPFIAVTLALALVFAFIFTPLFWLLLILAGWMVDLLPQSRARRARRRRGCW